LSVSLERLVEIVCLKKPPDNGQIFLFP